MKKVKARKSGFLSKITKKVNRVKSAPSRAGKAAANGVWKKLRSIDKADRK